MKRDEKKMAYSRLREAWSLNLADVEHTNHFFFTFSKTFFALFLFKFYSTYYTSFSNQIKFNHDLLKVFIEVLFCVFLIMAQLKSQDSMFIKEHKRKQEYSKESNKILKFILKLTLKLLISSHLLHYFEFFLQFCYQNFNQSYFIIK